MTCEGIVAARMLSSVVGSQIATPLDCNPQGLLRAWDAKCISAARVYMRQQWSLQVQKVSFAWTDGGSVGSGR